MMFSNIPLNWVSVDYDDIYDTMKRPSQHTGLGFHYLMKCREIYRSMILMPDIIVRYRECYSTDPIEVPGYLSYEIKA